jgi:PAS domain S-box-containing protein
MSTTSRHKAKSFLVLAISVPITFVAALYVSTYPSLSPSLLAVFLFVTAFLNLLLLVVARSEASARAAVDEHTRELREAKEGQERCSIQLEQHRTKLKELISQMPGVVWEMHGTPETAFTLTFISDYVETMLGYAVAESAEMPNLWMSAVHPEDRDRVARDLALVFRTGTGGTKFRWIAKDGRELWVETHAAVVVDEDGEPAGLRGVTMDITARHRAEETLRDKEVRLQIALSAARMASWQWDLLSGSLVWDDTPLTWADFIRRVHPDDQVTVRDAVDGALRDREDLDFEFRVIQPDGGLRWLVLKARVFQGQDGRPAYITGVSIDVTDRRKAAEALRASEERYRLAARATNDAIWDWDLTTGLVQWNEGIRTLFGYAAEQVGTDIAWRFNQIHPDDRDRVVSGFNAVIEGGGRFWSDEYRFRCASGSYAVVSDRAYIEHDEFGKAVRLIAAMTDVTRLKQAEREREQLLRLEHTARKQAESANRVKDEFIATLSHELRTPLTPILGWTQLLRYRGTDPATLQRGLDVIEQNARSQTRLIDDLLDVSRIVTGKMQVRMQPVEVQSILNAAIDAIQPAADSKGVRIEIPKQRTPIQLIADPDRLQQVFWNLLSNAIKFTPGGGSVNVSMGQVGNELKIVVRDSGEGIDPEFLPHVFERFSQADSTNVRAHGGLGVGLAIVRYIVELHGGTVSVDSAGKGRGATFTVLLPIRLGEIKTRQKRSKRLDKGGMVTLKGLRLMVVDDEPDVRELLALVLRHEGAVVTTAASAQEALEALRANPADVLISDIGMPEESGYVLLEKLRELERQQERHPIPAIALTAYVREEDRKRTSEAGFEVHLSKPVESDKLISAIIAVATGHLGRAV